jgi:hypothetical protein
MSNELEAHVEEVHQQALKYHQQIQVESEVARAKTELSRYNKKLEALERDLEKLRFYEGVVVRICDVDIPESVETAYRKASTVGAVDDDDLLNTLEQKQIETEFEHISEVEDAISDATDKLSEKMKAHQRIWNSQVETAEAVVQVIGASDDLQGVIKGIKSFVNTEMWNKKRYSPTGLESTWQGYMNVWKKNPINWEEYQREHDLSDETIRTLKQLARSESTSLDNITEQSFRELKRVGQLKREIKMSI